MIEAANPSEAEQSFFASLLAADVSALDRLLTDDFILVDVMAGSEISKEAFLGVVGPGHLKFLSIDHQESRVRSYGQAAVITGRTEMKGEFMGDTFEAKSRYTHVFISLDGRWRMVSAQGTQIVEEEN